MQFQQAFDSFMIQDFQRAADSSTIASWSGSGYSVELFDDGTYRCLWVENIGNRYDSPGLILSVPALDDEEWQVNPNLSYYDNAEQAIREAFQEYCGR